MDHAGAVTGPLISAIILYILLGHRFWQGFSETNTPNEMWALRLLFGIALIPGIFAMFIIIGKVKEIPWQKNMQADIMHSEPTHHLPWKFYLYLGIVVLFTLGNSSDLFLILYAKTKFNLGLGSVIGLWVALHISKIIFSFPGGILSDKFGRRIVILAGWFAYITFTLEWLS